MFLSEINAQILQNYSAFVLWVSECDIFENNMSFKVLYFFSILRVNN